MLTNQITNIFHKISDIFETMNFIDNNANSKASMVKDKELDIKYSKLVRFLRLRLGLKNKLIIGV